MSNNSLETATLGGGCFWCLEAIYQDVTGVEKVVSGYSGGMSPTPPTSRFAASIHRPRRGRAGHL
ncbi:MAG: peptide-methionine (S)-S-oxide reductase [Chloroflexota bacterium]